jgi:hypothetical protein
MGDFFWIYGGVKYFCSGTFETLPLSFDILSFQNTSTITFEAIPATNDSGLQCGFSIDPEVTGVTDPIILQLIDSPSKCVLNRLEAAM